MRTVARALEEYVSSTFIEPDTYVGEIYDAFKAGVEFAQQWISVEIELPKILGNWRSKRVLICNNPEDSENIRIGFRLINEETEKVHWNENENPKYWRPIEYK